MQHQKWLKFDHAKWTVNQALEKLNSIIDESDPDTTLPNIVHAYQTAERARSAHPDEDWLHLTGLIHDLGKVMAFWGEPQWAVVGDTYPVGCKPVSSIVFRDSGAFEKNADCKTGLMKSELGMYKKHCGLENLMMSWGHDEYLYQVIANHTSCTLPDEALYIIRFHSFYPWHSAGQYSQFTNEKDRSMLYWIKEFNKFDLYSKVDQPPNIDHLRTYYDGLIEKYVPGLVYF
uniref:Inositol oxygenase n=1 Tax=Romanomermis culicivorax TaxID=13658 RepID=A0A915HV37_ROMCU